MYIMDDMAEIGGEIHIWKDDKLVFSGKYSKDNQYAKEEVISIGCDEDLETYELYTSYCLKDN